MANGTERRASRRFALNLPVMIRRPGDAGDSELRAETRDVSFRGLYFLIEGSFEEGMPIEFILTLPKEITLASDVHIRCFGEVVRVEPLNSHRGVAARIDRYEFLPAPA
ncbi:MAG: PilZ domain-containing protein [Acidobacteriia bacterium]|jgi:hypothetical protein|nr:PilZ domain-containing protein [Terriglobia bacterium]